ncbi:hypothetical protein PCANC_26431 [Puccinia coronata f. sp. avenae]|uniref:Uncharacterized protein n=1 Tax=Puccinia coronata f. sp. avenae TaxID=200324 RepID=A0A2N5RZY0_9BASI|nr:hypothetical protein PCANC_26431 [Puccinia coronata f. sp. avenae]
MAPSHPGTRFGAGTRDLFSPNGTPAPASAPAGADRPGTRGYLASLLAEPGCYLLAEQEPGQLAGSRLCYLLAEQEPAQLACSRLCYLLAEQEPAQLACSRLCYLLAEQEPAQLAGSRLCYLLAEQEPAQLASSRLCYLLAEQEPAQLAGYSLLGKLPAPAHAHRALPADSEYLPATYNSVYIGGYPPENPGTRHFFLHLWTPGPAHGHGSGYPPTDSGYPPRRFGQYAWPFGGKMASMAAQLS